MTATLADVNTTLGITNIALSSVVSEQKETNKGISAFVDFIKDKDADDSRKQLEANRETKPILKSIGSGASAIGGGLVSAGKSTFGFGKGLLSKLAIPAGFVGGFLTSLLSSKLLRAGLAGLGVYFGDEIADYLLGDDAKDEVKKAFGNVIKGASIGGFLFGKKGFLIGGALTALLQNKKVDEELGRLTTNINEFAKKIGFKDGLLGVIQGIGNAVGTGLQGLNDLADGKVDFKSVSSTLGLLGGAAFLVSPRGSAKLAVAAGLALARSPAGRILMALAGLAYAGSNIFGDDTKGSNPEIDNKMGTNEVKLQGGDVGGLSKYFTLDNIIGATTAAYLTKSLYDLGTGGINLFKKFGKFGKATDTATDAINVMQQANKGPGFFKTMANSLKSGASKFGMLMTRAGPIALPLAAMGGLLYVLNNKESSQALAAETKADKLKGTMTKSGVEFGISKYGSAGTDLEMAMPDNFMATRLTKVVKNDPLKDYFKNLPPAASTMDPTGNEVNVVNSNNRTINNNSSTGIAINNSGAIDRNDLSLGNQIRLAGATGLF